MRLLWSLLDTTKPTVSPIDFPERKPILYPKEELFFEGTTPEDCGIESGYVKSFIDELRNNKTVGLQSLMLMRNGKVFFEADAVRQDSKYPKATFSECKSIVSLAIGVLVTQGKLRLNERVIDILSEKASAFSKVRLNGLTVKHLLTMTSCVSFNEAEAMVSDDWVKSFLESDIDGEIGKNFKYNSLNTYILSAIIKERTNMGLSEFLDNTIFKELEIDGYYWEKCPMGIEKGGWGLYIRREDLAKLGLLVMNDGVWNDKRLISAKYLKDATDNQVETSFDFGDYNYGFHIWCHRENNSFLFNGMLGQNLIGFKDSGIMIIANCGNADTFQKNDFFEICNRYFSREFTEKIHENQKDYENLIKLKKKIKSKPSVKSFLEIPKHQRDLEKDLNAMNKRAFKVESQNGISTGLSPIFMQLVQGNYTSGLKEIGFFKSGNILEAVFYENQENHILRVGFEKPEISVITFKNEAFTVSIQGKFGTNEDRIPILTIDCDFLETPYQRRFKFYFDENDYYAVFEETPAKDFARNISQLSIITGENGQKIQNIFSKLDGDYFSIKLENTFTRKLILSEITESETSG